MYDIRWMLMKFSDVTDVENMYLEPVSFVMAAKARERQVNPSGELGKVFSWKRRSQRSTESALNFPVRNPIL